MSVQTRSEKLERWLLRILLASTVVGVPVLYYLLFIVPVTHGAAARGIAR